MHILICNERFLFRFGLDRSLIILGKGLAALGHSVSIMANKYDREVLETFTRKIIDVPETNCDYLNSNELTEKWLKNTWGNLFDNDNKPDIILSGGWPFFSSIPFFRGLGIPVVFFDCGAVPLKGYTDGFLITQKKLREQRQRYLADVTAIIAISDFIANTQSRIDIEYERPVKTIHLGADHLEMNIWQDSCDSPKNSCAKKFDLVKKTGKHCILNLGRWEPGCYKNSEAIFEIFRRIKKEVPDCIIVVLDTPSAIQTPPDLADSVYPIGFPTDDELKYLMVNADLGISTSLWEGFNLPLAEMQWLNKQALVFDVGAHPEVVIHPWYLCRDNREMANKAVEVLNGKGLDRTSRTKSSEKFHSMFTWERATMEMARFLQDVVHNSSKKTSPPVELIIDVTNAARDSANSGVIRVTRRICRELQKYVTLLFVIWDCEINQYIFLTRDEFQQLSQFNGPVKSEYCILSPDNARKTLSEYLEKNPDTQRWLIFTETIDETRAKVIRQFARRFHISLAAVFYDAIPVLFPELCKDVDVKANHSHYMTGLAECSIVIPISDYSARCLETFWKERALESCRVIPDILPGEFGGSTRNVVVQDSPCENINILCVSTLEPRKNHKTLIDACLLMQEDHPEINWTLTLVGNRYAGAFEIADGIQQISKVNPRIHWKGVVSDETLHRLYEEATFTVYPSIIEGFGMPILESIWHGKPVICSNQGVMSELAADGGCLTTEILDAKKLADTIYRLCVDHTLAIQLCEDAVKRPIKTWDEYTRQFLSILGIEPDTEPSSISDGHSFEKIISRWDDVLYPDCLCANWQMNHSERMALTALLLRLKPQYSIEIGTYKGGSLSLIAQLSRFVYSLDIDPSIPEKFGYLKNVTFLTGSSLISLPVLLEAFDTEKIPVDFILIDGDHSAEGVKKDLNSVFAYVPKKPLFIMLHDSFNPECRRGMLEADWNSSPYIQWADLDFVPGRIVENGSTSQGEMWGGLALVYMTPFVRNEPLSLDRSANMLYEFMKTYSKQKTEL
jgi:glycosyltransferase involved in cell wall biosynthesis